MADLEKESVDTIITPDQGLTEEMKQEGTDNDMEHNTFNQRGQEVDLVGGGVPGYETTGQEGTNDQLEDEKEDVPGPMKTPKP